MTTTGQSQSRESRATGRHTPATSSRRQVLTALSGMCGVATIGSDTSTAATSTPTPTAAFDHFLTDSRPEQNVTLDGTPSAPSEGIIKKYEWQIARTDGTHISDDGPDLRVLLVESGEYQVSLTVTDSAGRTDRTTKIIELRNAALPTGGSVQSDMRLFSNQTSKKTLSPGEIATETVISEESDILAAGINDLSVTEILPAMAGATGIAAVGVAMYALVRRITGDDDEDRGDGPDINASGGETSSGPAAMTETSHSGRNASTTDDLLTSPSGSEPPSTVENSSPAADDDGVSDVSANADDENYQQTESNPHQGSSAKRKSKNSHSPDGSSTLPAPVEEELADAAGTLETALTEPFANTEATKNDLLRAHNAYVATIEQLTTVDGDASEELSDAEASLENIESKIEALADIAPELEHARSLTPEERLNDRGSKDSLQAQVDRYNEAIQIASAAGFDTAGLEDERTSARRALDHVQPHPPKEDLVHLIERTHEELGTVPTAAEVADYAVDRPNVSKTVYDDAFGSWQTALEACEFDAAAECQSELRRVADELGHPPTQDQFDSHSEWSSRDIIARFGSWGDALAYTCATAELTTDERGNVVPQAKIKRENYLEELQDFAESTDAVLKPPDFREFGTYSAHEVIQEFGSWQEALNAADIDNKQRFLDEMDRVWDKIGQEPSRTDINEHAQLSAGLYDNYFESFDAAVDRVRSSRPDDREKMRNDATETTEDTSLSESYHCIADIEADRRLDEPIAVKILDVRSDPGEKKTARLRVSDPNGDTTHLNIWEVHNVGQSWEAGKWYALSEARAKMWEKTIGNAQRWISSTRDLAVEELGKTPLDDRDDIDGGPDLTREPDIEQTDQETESATADNQDSEDPDEDEPEVSSDDGILGDIKGEFDVGPDE